MLHQLTEPAVEPLTSADAVLRQHLRLMPGEVEENGLVDALAASARDWAEGYTRRRFITQSLQLVLPGFHRGRIALPVAPVASVEAIRYATATGDLAALDPADWRMLKSGPLVEVAPAIGRHWPAVPCHPAARVEIDFTAGYGATAAAVPPGILAAIRLVAAHHYAHREAVAAGGMAGIPLGAEDILARYRVFP